MSTRQTDETNKVTEIVSKRIARLGAMYIVRKFGKDTCVVYGINWPANTITGTLIELIDDVARIISISELEVDGKTRICALVEEKFNLERLVDNF